MSLWKIGKAPTFIQDRDVSERPLEVVYIDVWVQHKSSQLHRAAIMLLSLMITLKRYGCSSWKQRVKCLITSRCSKLGIKENRWIHKVPLQLDGGGEYFSHEFSRFLDN